MAHPNPDFQSLARTWVTLLVPFVTCLFWLFTLQARTDANASEINDNKVAIEKMEIRVENMNNTLQETHTNVKLIQLQMEHISTQLEELVNKQ